VSVISAGGDFDEAGIHTDDDASPLGAHSSTPWVAGPVVPGRWHSVVVGLWGKPDGDDGPQRERQPTVALDLEHTRVRVNWPDGLRTEAELPRSPSQSVPRPETN
jgi:hypothetical protein